MKGHRTGDLPVCPDGIFQTASSANFDVLLDV